MARRSLAQHKVKNGNMATGTAKPAQPPAAAVNAEQFIEQQLTKTRFQVRVVDLVSSLMALAAAVLAFTLVLAIVDHWVMPLAWWGRWLACIALLAGVGYYIAVVVVPLMLRPINPVYAAKAIEQSDPTLKNSLINFLLLRDDRRSTHQLVFSAVQQRAAADLQRATIDHAVDRSKVIHFGYLLVGVLVVSAVYTIFSPKDSLQSASRVIAPWASIERPTRVQIHDVTPGDITVFQGDRVDVSCRLEGAAEVVTLYYSSLDGEIDNQPVEMRLDSDGLRYTCQLPPRDTEKRDAEKRDDGMQQAVSYRIEAVDATSATYQIDVSPAPHITVQQLDYAFPKYTNRPTKTVQGSGDIKALEGTRVTIHAKSNQPIRSAFIDLQDVAGKMSTLEMEARGNEASRAITLELQADRSTPVHTAYQVRFVTDEGRESEDPILHRIEVLPDLPPEISILTPRQEVTEVPENGSQTIEVRAIDPDYAVTSVKLHIVAGGTTLIDKVLLSDSNGVSGQAVKQYEFRPHLFGLEVGDRATFRATVADNRTSSTGSPEPNEARTKDFQLLIVPRSSSDAESGGAAESEKQPPDPSNSDSSDDGSSDGDSGDSTKGDDPETGESDSAEESETGGEGEAGDDGKQDGGEQSGDQQQAGSESGEEEGGSESSDQGSGAGEQQKAGGQDGASGGQPQAGQAGGGEQSGGNTPQNQGGAGGEPGTGEQSTGEQGPDEPLHDGEVFEKTLERLKQQAKDAGQNGKGRSSEGEPQGNSDEQGDGPKTSAQNPGSGNSGPKKGGSDGDSEKGSNNEKHPNGDEKDSSKQQAEPDNSDSQQPAKGAQHEDNNMGAGAQKDAATGEGGTSEKPDRPTGKNGAEPDDGDNREPPGPKDMRQKDPGAGDSGDSGAGQNSKDTSGTGSVDSVKEQGEQEKPVENRDRPKSMQPDSSEPQDEDAPGFTKDKKQSDSKGGASGDKSGGGKKGPGQGANQAGNDSPGQNNAADEGAGAASEAGNGETSSGAGDKQRAEGETGSAGDEQGEGSASRNDPSGDRSGSGKQPPRNPLRDDPSTNDDPQGSDGGPQQGGDGRATGGGLPSDGIDGTSIDRDLDVPPGDEANLEYARRATDMVLEYLKDQEDNPDSELLDELGWTEAELKAFLNRWQQLKNSADEDVTSKRELNESLRSLGLRPKRDRIRQGTTENDGNTGLRDSGNRTAPPPAYQKLFDAFKKGAARSTRASN